MPSGTFATTTTTVPPSTTTTNPDQPVLVAIDLYKVELLRAFDPANPSYAGLAQVATGRQLENWQRGLADRQARGESLRGTLDFRHPRVLERGADSARVEVCIGDGLTVYGPNGEAKQVSRDLEHQLSVMTLVIDGGRWKVATSRSDGAPCEP